MESKPLNTKSQKAEGPAAAAISKHKLPSFDSPEFRKYMNTKITIDLPTFRQPFSVFVQNVPYLNFCIIVHNYGTKKPHTRRQVTAAYIQILIKKFDEEKDSAEAVQKRIELSAKAQVNKHAGKRKFEEVDYSIIKRRKFSGASPVEGRSQDAADGMVKVTKDKKAEKDKRGFNEDVKIGELNDAIQQANTAEAEKYWTEMAKVLRVKKNTDFAVLVGEPKSGEAVASLMKLFNARRAAGLL